MFSKSFGYALRGILYITSMQDENRSIQVDEIAAALGVPRHFMGKIMKNLVKHGILSSSKGPGGGFFPNEKTLQTAVIEVANITEGHGYFENCALRLTRCNAQNPCPLHYQIVTSRDQMKHLLDSTLIKDLLKGSKADLIRGLSTIPIS